MTPDVNVLVAAFRRDHTHHTAPLNWLQHARTSYAEGTASLTLLPVAVVGFLRLVTNPRMFIDPDAIEDAVTFVDALLNSAGVELQGSGTELPLLREKLLNASLHGNDVTDAWIAAATEALSEPLVAFDSDFKRLLPARDVTVLEQSR